MWVGLLGPLSVRGDGVAVPIPAARQRAVLGVLAVRAGQVVSIDELADMVWDGAPPAAARPTLRAYMKRLRQQLGPGLAGRLVTRQPGYLLVAADDEVDLLVFDRTWAEGAAAVQAKAWPQAWRVLGQALGLWRGEPLADIAGESLRRELLPRLEAQRLQATEWRVEAGLALGRHGELVAELTVLAGAYPLRERFCAQSMLALYRCGRRGEALAAYQQARRTLVDELGVEPGSELCTLHEQVLAADPVLAAPSPDIGDPGAGGRTAPGPVTPRHLPSAVPGFAGRAAELTALTTLAQRAGGAATAVISAIGGTAGVGKLRWRCISRTRPPPGSRPGSCT